MKFWIIHSSADIFKHCHRVPALCCKGDDEKAKRAMDLHCRYRE
jgi:hypothetical protein